jgi:uncharacterized protein YdhG (YjbR/CyaY superfamily)
MPAETVDAYIAALPQPARRIVNRVRTVIRKSMPGCEESIAYGMPAYKLAGKSVLFFAAWKKHWALYPAYPSVVAAFAKELAPYDVDKGTIRFPYDGRLPVHLIGGIAKLRLAESKAKSRKSPRVESRRGRAKRAR